MFAPRLCLPMRPRYGISCPRRKHNAPIGSFSRRSWRTLSVNPSTNGVMSWSRIWRLSQSFPENRLSPWEKTQRGSLSLSDIFEQNLPSGVCVGLRCAYRCLRMRVVSVLKSIQKYFRNILKTFTRHHESFPRVSRDFRVALSMGGIVDATKCLCVCVDNMLLQINIKNNEIYSCHQWPPHWLSLTVDSE